MLLFDAHKLVIEEDFLRVIEAVVGATSQGQPSRKVRLVLNKVDDVATEDLLNVYGQLMWTLASSGKVLLNQVLVLTKVSCAFEVICFQIYFTPNCLPHDMEPFVTQTVIVRWKSACL